MVLQISNQLHVRIIPAFRCGGMWPRSAANWPRPECTIWPPPSIVQQIKVKLERFFIRYKIVDGFILRLMDSRWYQEMELEATPG